MQAPRCPICKEVAVVASQPYAYSIVKARNCRFTTWTNPADDERCYLLHASCAGEFEQRVKQGQFIK